MNLWINPSLKQKVFLSVAISYLAAVGSLTYLTIRSHRSLLLEQMTERARTGINLMELSVANRLYRLDVFQLETIAREAKALPDVEYVYIYDAKGRIVGDFHEDRRQLFATFTDELGQRINKSDKTLVQINSGKGILDISKPVYLNREKLGGIRLGLNLNPLFDEMHAITIKAVVISAVIFLVGLLAIFIITRRFIRPIETLTLAANRIEKGDLQYRVNIVRDDEIGTLAAAFDRMADRLMQRERELKQSQTTLRRADRLSSLGLLTAGLAHEIRNPLVAIRTFTQLLSQAKEKNVEITREFDLRVPKVWIDKEQMKQVFMNLILNAIQAMKGGGSIVISTRISARNNDELIKECVQVEIRDTGVGIPEENLEHIFDPFFTSKDEGSGLGLAVSHQIVQEHGGFLTVESTVGKGTTFFVHVPVGKPVRPAANGRAQVNEANLNH